MLPWITLPGLQPPFRMATLLDHYREVAAAAQAEEAVERAPVEATSPLHRLQERLEAPAPAPTPGPAELDFELESGEEGSDDEGVPPQEEEDAPDLSTASAGLWPGLEEAESFAAGLAPSRPFVDRQRCAHAFASDSMVRLMR